MSGAWDAQTPTRSPLTQHCTGLVPYRRGSSCPGMASGDRELELLSHERKLSLQGVCSSTSRSDYQAHCRDALADAHKVISVLARFIYPGLGHTLQELAWFMQESRNCQAGWHFIALFLWACVRLHYKHNSTVCCTQHTSCVPPPSLR